MKTDRILLPIDLAKCPLDAFPLINSLAERSADVTVILLHVLDLNILAPESRIYDELCSRARQHLQRLAREQVHPLVDIALHIRVGNPFEEIVDEARQCQVQLIILPTFERAFWKRLLAPVLPRARESLAEKAPCPVYAIRVEKSFNCQEHWKTEQEVAVGVKKNTGDDVRSGRSRRPSFATGYSN